MKKIGIIVILVVLITLNFAFTNHVYGEVIDFDDVSINDENLELRIQEDMLIFTINGEEDQIDNTQIVSYSLWDSDFESIISHHVICGTDKYVILPGDVGDSIYACLMVNGDTVETYITEIDVNVFDWLSFESESVTCESEFGHTLLENASKFEKLHFPVVENQPFQPAAVMLERNNYSIEQMTKSDQYLDGYYVNSSKELGYPTVEHDRIINIVPENWFTYPGTYIHTGKEYGVYVQTQRVFNGFYNCYVYSTDVVVYDFETYLPFYKDKNVADDGAYEEMDQYKFTIETKIIQSYYTLNRTDVGYSKWIQNFSPAESNIIVARSDVKNNVKIAPQHDSFLVDYSSIVDEYNVGGREIWAMKNYSYKFSSTENQTYINQASLGHNLRGLALDILGLIPGNPVTATVFMLSLINDFHYTYTMNQHTNAIQNLEYVSGEVHHHFKSFNEGQSVQIPGTNEFRKILPQGYAVDFQSYSNVFSNYILKDYKHTFGVTLIDLVTQGYYDFMGLCITTVFNFYDNNGQLMVQSGQPITRQRQVRYDRLTHYYIDSLEPNSIGSTPISKTITSTTTALNFKVRSSSDKLYKLQINAVNATYGYTIDIYSEEGELVKAIETYSSKLEVNFCYFKAFSNYTAVVSFKNNRTGNISIQFLDVSSHSVSSVNTTIAFNASNGQRDIRKINFLQFGEYRFSTYSGYDTSLRLYDKNGNLIIESLDPFADWSEDYQDLYAEFVFHHRLLTNSEYYLEIYVAQQSAIFNTTISKQ